MRLNLAADALQKVRDAEPEVDCGWSLGAEGKYWLFSEVGTWFIHTNMMLMYQLEFLRSSYTRMLDPARGWHL